MINLTLDDLLDQLEQARQMAIEERKPTAMIQATVTTAKLLGLDKPVIKDVNADEVQTISDLMNDLSAEQAAIAYKDIMGWRMKTSIDDLVAELDDARLTAKANGQASAMVTATMSKAKLLGLDKGVNNDAEVQPVKIVIKTVDARKPDIKLINSH